MSKVSVERKLVPSREFTTRKTLGGRMRLSLSQKAPKSTDSKGSSSLNKSVTVAKLKNTLMIGDGQEEESSLTRSLQKDVRHSILTYLMLLPTWLICSGMMFAIVQWVLFLMRQFGQTNPALALALTSSVENVLLLVGIGALFKAGTTVSMTKVVTASIVSSGLYNFLLIAFAVSGEQVNEYFISRFIFFTGSFYVLIYGIFRGHKMPASVMVCITLLAGAINCLMLVYFSLGSSSTLEYYQELLLTGVVHPLFMLIMGRVLLIGFASFMLAKYSPMPSITRLTQWLTLFLKQYFLMAGEIVLLSLRSRFAFLFALILSQVGEIASVFINDWALRSTKISNLVQKIKVAVTSTSVHPSSGDSSNGIAGEEDDEFEYGAGGEKNVLGEWIDQLQSDREIKLMLMYQEEEKVDKLNVLCAITASIFILHASESKSITLLTDPVPLDELLFRGLLLFLVEFIEEILRKKALYYVARIDLSREKPTFPTFTTIVASATNVGLVVILYVNGMSFRTYIYGME